MAMAASSGQREYLVYILSGRAKKTIAGISEKDSFLIADESIRSLKLIYFESFSDRSKAMKRKSKLDKLSDTERLKLIKKKNPELLNLIFIIKDNYLNINKYKY